MDLVSWRLPQGLRQPRRLSTSLKFIKGSQLTLRMWNIWSLKIRSEPWVLRVCLRDDVYIVVALLRVQVTLDYFAHDMKNVNEIAVKHVNESVNVRGLR